MTLLLISSSAIIIYLCRLSGFFAKSLSASPLLTRFLHYVPIAIFAALIVPSTMREPELLWIKIVALAGAGLIVRWTRQYGIGVIVGYVLFVGLIWVSN